MTKKVKEVRALLEANGWMHVRTRGDHFIYRKDGAPRSIVLPGKPNDDLAIGTLGSILRQAGLNMSDFDRD
ncbi:MAG: type II toxin-antitoxin system HicA family toxin [Bacteroides sp.]|nr:type II toxin-antitoxin system HicA family toxin [Bacteroides sp.]